MAKGQDEMEFETSMKTPGFDNEGDTIIGAQAEWDAADSLRKAVYQEPSSFESTRNSKAIIPTEEEADGLRKLQKELMALVESSDKIPQEKKTALLDGLKLESQQERPVLAAFLPVVRSN